MCIYIYRYYESISAIATHQSHSHSGSHIYSHFHPSVFSGLAMLNPDVGPAVDSMLWCTIATCEGKSHQPWNSAGGNRGD